MNDNPIHDLATIRKISLYCAAVTLAVSCLMSFKFGWSMSVLHAVGLGLITICTAIIFPYIGHQWSGGSKWYAGALVPIAMLLCLVEFGTHTGYTNGVRTIETEDTGYKNAAYKTKQDSAARNAKELADFKADREKIEAETAWVTTTTPDGLRAQIAPMTLAIEQETARGGCGPKCLSLTKEKAAIEEKIALVDRYDTIQKAIAEHQKTTNAREDAAVTAEFKTSEVVAQTNIFAKLAAWSLEPTDGQKEGTQVGVGLAMALATTFLPAVFMLMAFGPAEYVPGHSGRVAQATEKVTDEAAAMLRRIEDLAAQMAPQTSGAPANPVYLTENRYEVKDDKEAQGIRARCLAAAAAIERKAA